MPTKKDEYATPVQKAVSLFGLLLFTGRKFHLAELARELKCSKQTVIRMMEQIERSFSTPIDTGIENRTRWYKVKTPRSRPHISLSPEEISHLLMCKDMVSHLLPEDMSERLLETVGKTTVLLPEMESRDEALEVLAGVMAKGGIDYTPFEPTIKTLLEAVREKRVLEIHYLKPGGGKARKHHFAPTRLIAYREALYLEGYKVSIRGKVSKVLEMTLPIHRFKAVEPTRLHHDFEEEPAPNYFGFKLSDPFRAKVRFGPEAVNYIQERKWSDTQKIFKQKDGGLILEFMVQSEPELISWVLSFGPNAELLQPTSTRHILKKNIERLRQVYSL